MEIPLLDNTPKQKEVKAKSQNEIQYLENFLEPLISFYKNQETVDLNKQAIVDIFLNIGLCSEKAEEQNEEEIRGLIAESVPKWRLNVYPSGEFIYHFGEDGKKVFLVLKGEALELKPKLQNIIDKEIQQNQEKMNNQSENQRAIQFNSLKADQIKPQISLKQGRGQSESSKQSLSCFQSEINISPSKGSFSNLQLASQATIPDLPSLIETNQSFRIIKMESQKENSEKEQFNSDTQIKEDKTKQTLIKFKEICLRGVMKKSQTKLMELPGFKKLFYSDPLINENKEMYFDENTKVCKFAIDANKRAGQLFGKSSIENNKCRMTTVIVGREDLTVLEISKSLFMKLFLRKKEIKESCHSLQEDPLNEQKHQLFQSLFDSTQSELQKFMSFFHYCVYSSNTVIWTKKSVPEKILIVLSGRVELSDNALDSKLMFKNLNLNRCAKNKNKRRVILESGAGNMIGEIEFIDKLKERLYQAKSTEKTECFWIDIDHFRLCENFVPAIIKQIKEKSEIKKNWIKEYQQKIDDSLIQYEQKQQLIPSEGSCQEAESINKILNRSYSVSFSHKNPKEKEGIQETLLSKWKMNKKMVLQKMQSCAFIPEQDSSITKSFHSSKQGVPNYLGSSSIPRRSLIIDLFSNKMEENCSKKSFLKQQNSSHLSTQVSFFQDKQKVSSNLLDSPNSSCLNQSNTPSLIQIKSTNKLRPSKSLYFFNSTFDFDKGENQTETSPVANKDNKSNKVECNYFFNFNKSDKQKQSTHTSIDIKLSQATHQSLKTESVDKFTKLEQARQKSSLCSSQVSTPKAESFILPNLQKAEGFLTPQFCPKSEKNNLPIKKKILFSSVDQKPFHNLIVDARQNYDLSSIQSSKNLDSSFNYFNDQQSPLLLQNPFLNNMTVSIDVQKQVSQEYSKSQMVKNPKKNHHKQSHSQSSLSNLCTPKPSNLNVSSQCTLQKSKGQSANDLKDYLNKLLHQKKDFSSPFITPKQIFQQDNHEELHPINILNLSKFIPPKNNCFQLSQPPSLPSSLPRAYELAKKDSQNSIFEQLPALHSHSNSAPSQQYDKNYWVSQKMNKQDVSSIFEMLNRSKQCKFKSISIQEKIINYGQKVQEEVNQVRIKKEASYLTLASYANKLDLKVGTSKKDISFGQGRKNFIYKGFSNFKKSKNTSSSSSQLGNHLSQMNEEFMVKSVNSSSKIIH